MINNRFFSPVVRIQHERGHTLITSGPYRFVRHPGYVGAILACACGGVALGSWWSLGPLGPFAAPVLRGAAGGGSPCRRRGGGRPGLWVVAGAAGPLRRPVPAAYGGGGPDAAGGPRRLRRV